MTIQNEATSTTTEKNMEYFVQKYLFQHDPYLLNSLNPAAPLT